MGKKYNNKKVVIDGHEFSSLLEGDVYKTLKLLQAAGEISGLTPHPGKIYLTDAKILYKPDFGFTRKGTLEYAEAKGRPDAKWGIKKRLWKVYGPSRLDLWVGVYRGWTRTGVILKETIVPQRGSDVSGGGKGDLHKKRKPKPKAKE